MSQTSTSSDAQGRVAPFLLSIAVIVTAFAVGVTLALVGYRILISAGLTTASAIDNGESTLAFLTGSGLQFVGFGVVIFGYFHVRSDWEILDVKRPGLRSIAWAIGGFLGLLVTVYLLQIIITLLDLQTAENAVVSEGQRDPIVFLYMIPITILLVAPAEELLFRGIVQGLFRRVYGAIPAVLIASVLFGVVHVVALIGSGTAILTYIAVASTLGLWLGGLYERTENILVPIAVHGLWNAFLFTMQYVVVTQDLAA